MLTIRFANIPTMNLDDGKILMGVGRGRVVFAITRECIISTFAQTTGKTYFYTTKNLEKGPWKFGILPRLS